MHTAFDLQAALFDITIGNEAAGLPELFPGWSAHDRFGIVMTEPFGALGASLLIQLAVVAFYDAVPARRVLPARYPEIYLFHVGGRFGDFSSFDFWPPRKEVFLPHDANTVLEALNDRAITRLAVPEAQLCADKFADEVRPHPAAFAYKEPAAAAERIASCFAYGAGGRAAAADVRILARDPILSRYADSTLDVLAALAKARTDPVSDQPERRRDRVRWLAQLGKRADEVSNAAPVRDTIRASRASGPLLETFRRLEIDEALQRLTG